MGENLFQQLSIDLRFFRDGDNLIPNKLNITKKINSFFTNVGVNLSDKIDTQ